MACGLVARPAPTCCHSRRSWVRPPWTPTKSLHHEGVPHGSPCLGHVEPYHWSKNTPRVNIRYVHLICQITYHVSLCHITTCHMSIWYHATSTPPPSQQSTSPCHVSVRSALLVVQTEQSSKKFHVWQSGQNTISLAYNVHLNPFKLHWDRGDEAYT